MANTADQPPTSDERTAPSASAEAGAAPPPVTLAGLVDAIARAAERLRRDDGDELRRHAEDVRDRALHLGQTMQAAEGGDPARAAACAALEELVDAVGKAGAAAGRAVARQGEAIPPPRFASLGVEGIDPGSLAGGLRRLAALLAGGTPEGRARIQDLLSALEGAVGPSIGKLFADAAERQKRADEGGKKRP